MKDNPSKAPGFQKTPALDTQERILALLMHNPTMTFNKLWNKEGLSNKFAYHLKALIKKNLVKKTRDSKYNLTLDGKKMVAYMEEDSGKKSESPIVAVITIIVNDGKYLMLHRKKEPFYGYWGFHGSKLSSKNYILEQAKESIKNETGLICDLELKGLFSSKSYVGKQIIYNHQLFVVKAMNPKGILLEKTNKGSNHWVRKKEIIKLKILPNITHLAKIAEGKKFRWIEADRVHKNKGFSINIKKDVIF